MSTYRVAVGVDFGTTRTAAIVSVVEIDQHGDVRTEELASSMDPVQWDDDAFASTAVDMAFQRAWNRGDWQVILPDQQNPLLEKTRLIKSGLKSLAQILKGSATRKAVKVNNIEDLNASIWDILKSSTEEHLEREHAKIDQPEMWLQKAMEAMWTRFIDPAIQLRLRSDHRLNPETAIDVTLGVPAAWSTAASLRYGHVLGTGIPISLGSIGLLNEAHSTMMGKLINKEFAKDRLTVGSYYTIFDAGGGTIDVATFRLLDTSPVRLKPVPVEAVGSAWFGFETIMSRFKYMLEDLLREMLPAVKFGGLDLEDVLPEVMKSLRNQLHNYVPVSEGKEVEIRLHDDRFSFPESEHQSHYNGLGFSFGPSHTQDLFIQSNVVKAAVDTTVLPAAVTLVRHVEAIRKIIPRKDSLEGIFVTGGFGQSRYLQSTIRGKLKNIGLPWLPVFFDGDKYDKLELARGAAYFAGYPKASGGQSLKTALGVVTHLRIDGDKQGIWKDTVVKKNPGDESSWLLADTYSWAEDSVPIPALEFIEGNAVTITVAWVGNNNVQTLDGVPGNPRVFHSSARDTDNKVHLAAKVRIPLSNEALAGLARSGIYENGNNLVSVTVVLGWERSSIVCKIRLLLPSQSASQSPTVFLVGVARINMVENYRSHRENNQDDLPEVAIRLIEPAYGRDDEQNLTDRGKAAVTDAAGDVIMGEEEFSDVAANDTMETA